MSLVHLACAPVGTLLPAGDDWLSASERQRLQAIGTDSRRAQFLAARWLARTLLARVQGGAPGDWPLEAPHDAPPRVAGRADLVLSISHSGGWTACALAAQRVGIDLEQPVRARDVAGLVEIACTPRERALFAGLADAARDALFHELWTVKEAWLKSRGTWIAPAVLQGIEASRCAQGEVRTWRGAGWWLAVTGRAVQWWGPQPEALSAWSVAAPGCAGHPDMLTPPA